MHLWKLDLMFIRVIFPKHFQNTSFRLSLLLFLTLHDGYVHSPPAGPRHAAKARPVGDGRATSAGHQTGSTREKKNTAQQKRQRLLAGRWVGTVRGKQLWDDSQRRL